MFGRRFARAFFGGPWGPGVPPWAQYDPQGPWSHGGPWGHGGPWSHGGPGGWHSPEQQALRSTAAEVARLFMIASRSAAENPERQARLRGFLERSRKELTDLIYESGSSTSEKGNSPDVGQA